MQKLHKRGRWRQYWQGGNRPKHNRYACVIIGNVGDGNFRPSFFIKSNLNNGQASCREISHKHCK